MVTSGSGASINGVTIRPAAFSEVVVGSVGGSVAKFPADAETNPRIAATAAMFVSLDLYS